MPGVREVLQELRGNYDLWMIGSCPSDWLWTITEHLKLRQLFPEASVMVCPEWRLDRLVPDVLQAALDRAVKPVESCLLVAPDPETTAAAVELELNAIIFADARRLRRELALRKLLPRI